MDNYINNAKQFLTEWVDNLDVELFVKQYESLSHDAHIDQTPLDKMYLDKYILSCRNHALLSAERVYVEGYRKAVASAALSAEIVGGSLRMGSSAIATLYEKTVHSVDLSRDRLFIFQMEKSNHDYQLKETSFTVNRDNFGFCNNELNAA